jgi:hypothetical protein
MNLFEKINLRPSVWVNFSYLKVPFDCWQDICGTDMRKNQDEFLGIGRTTQLGQIVISNLYDPSRTVVII